MEVLSSHSVRKPLIHFEEKLWLFLRENKSAYWYLCANQDCPPSNRFGRFETNIKGVSRRRKPADLSPRSWNDWLFSQDRAPAFLVSICGARYEIVKLSLDRHCTQARYVGRGFYFNYSLCYTIVLVSSHSQYGVLRIRSNLSVHVPHVVTQTPVLPVIVVVVVPHLIWYVSVLVRYRRSRDRGVSLLGVPRHRGIWGGCGNWCCGRWCWCCGGSGGGGGGSVEVIVRIPVNRKVVALHRFHQRADEVLLHSLVFGVAVHLRQVIKKRL